MHAGCHSVGYARIFNGGLQDFSHVFRSVPLALSGSTGSHSAQPSQWKSELLDHVRLRSQRCPSIGGEGNFLRGMKRPPILDRLVLYSHNRTRSFTRLTYATARSPCSSAHTHCHSRDTYATRNTVSILRIRQFFPIDLKVRLLKMLHSIGPDYVII